MARETDPNFTVHALMLVACVCVCVCVSACVCVCLRVLTLLAHCCSVCKADQHVLSADGPGGAQYLTIEVGGALSQGVEHCLRGLRR